MHTKAKSMTHDIFHTLVVNSVNSELCFFWALLKAAKIWNSSKNTHVWAAYKTSSSKLKILFDPSLERSWCEFFKIIKGCGQKNPPHPSPGCNGSPPTLWFKNSKFWECSVHLYRGPCIIQCCSTWICYFWSVDTIYCWFGQIWSDFLSDFKQFQATWKYPIFLIFCFLGEKLMIVDKSQIPTNIPFYGSRYEP
jgi:hypothetical protein